LGPEGFWTPWLVDDDARAEFVVAITRVVLASSALVAVWFEPTLPAAYAGITRSLLAAYAGLGGLLLVWMHARAGVASSAGGAFLVFDLSAAMVLTVVTRGPASPFFPFLMFAVLSAAYRWGARETLMTAAVAIAGTVSEAVLVGTATPLSLGVVDGDFDVSRLILRVGYLATAGLLLAALAERENARRKEAATIAAIIDQAGTPAGLNGTLEAVLGVILGSFGADRALLALKHASTDRVFLWDAAPQPGTPLAIVAASELERKHRDAYLFDAPGPSWHAERFRASDWFDLLALDLQGRRLPAVAFTLPSALLARYRCASVLGVTIEFGDEWVGRLLLIDPSIGKNREGALRQAHRVARQIGPAAHQGHFLGTLRARAASAERARLARELHDGAVQALIAAEIQIDVVRRRSAADASPLTDDLAELQMVLRSETRKLRELTNRLRTRADAAAASTDLGDLVARFERDTGIQARVVCDEGVASMSRRSRHEAFHIVQEGLVNVRRHSGAHRVLVHAATAGGDLKLSIEDDGRGFPFSGRLAQAELTALNQGPAVIIERVRELGGHITVESKPGRGARLEVDIPLQR
jgi:signal transduction histidine kinase